MPAALKFSLAALIAFYNPEVNTNGISMARATAWSSLPMSLRC
jgi:hypothetical protein